MNNGGNDVNARLHRKTSPPLAVENLAIEALTLIGNDPDLASRFMSLSGFDVGSLRTVAKDSQFLAGVLDYVMSDEHLIVDLAAATGQPPESIVAACQSVKGPASDDFGL